MKSVKGEAQAAYLLELLRASPRPLGAYELLDRSRSKGIVSPIIVYRALKRLLNAGTIYRVASLNAFVAFRESARGEGRSNIQPICYAICDGCGTAKELEYPATNFPSKELPAFVPHTITVEVKGLCSDCQEQSAAKP